MARGTTLVRSALNRQKGRKNKTGPASAVNRNGKPRFVMCINNDGNYASLDVGKVYRALPTEKIARDHGMIRAIDNEVRTTFTRQSSSLP